jgi:threonine dehydratase
MIETALTMRDVYMARRRIAGIAQRTPLVHSPSLSALTGRTVQLKLENVQETGSFKIRGAANRMLSLSQEERARGVITVSSGNHGRAVAYVAGRLGVRAVVCVSTRVPANKVAAIQALGAEVVVHGESYDQATAQSELLEQQQGLMRIPPFDDPFIIAGQGTIGLELLEELPEIGTVVVPLSGGGLISGIGLAVKSADSGIRVIGVSMERAPVMVESLKAGRPVELLEEDTLADGLAGGIGLENKHTFSMVQRIMDEAVLVSEREIADAMVFALRTQHLVVEGSGAVGMAALLHGKIAVSGRNATVIISGGNVDVPLLLELTNRHPTA